MVSRMLTEAEIKEAWQDFDLAKGERVIYLRRMGYSELTLFDRVREEFADWEADLEIKTLLARVVTVVDTEQVARRW